MKLTTFGVDDDIPLRVVTRLDLDVAGRAREAYRPAGQLTSPGDDPGLFANNLRYYGPNESDR